MTIKRGEEFGCSRKAEALAMQDAGAKFQRQEKVDDWIDGVFGFVNSSDKYRRRSDCPMTFDCDKELKMAIKRGEEFDRTRKAEARAMQAAGAKFQIQEGEGWSTVDCTFEFTSKSRRYRRSPDCPAIFDCDNETVREFTVDSIAPGEVFSWHREDEALAMQNRGVKFEHCMPGEEHWTHVSCLNFQSRELVYRRAPEESFEDRCRKIENRIGEAKHELQEDGKIISVRLIGGLVNFYVTDEGDAYTTKSCNIHTVDIRMYRKHRDLIESVL